jgi:hypothetical protein
LVETEEGFVKGKYLALDNRRHKKEDVSHQLPAKGNHETQV